MVASVPLGLMSEFQAGARAGGPKSAGLSLFIWEGSPPPGYCADIPWDRTLSVAMLAARESEKSRFFLGSVTSTEEASGGKRVGN